MPVYTRTSFRFRRYLRLRPELRGNPVAVLSGRPPLEMICSMNRAARLRGVALGMTRVEAEAIQGLRLLCRSIECEIAAREVLLECAANFSPRIEVNGRRNMVRLLAGHCRNGTAVWAAG